MKKKTRNIVSLVINFVNAIMVFISVLDFFLFGGEGNMSGVNTECFRYYTIDSNLLMAISSIIILIYNVKAIRSGDLKAPRGVHLFKFVSVVATTVTFLTVMFFLGPTMGYAPMLASFNLFLHLICPVLAIISICIEKYDMSFKESILGISTVILYGTVYIIQVLILKNWPDFYGFNMGGMWYISLPLMILASFIISFVLYIVHTKVTKLIKE